MKEDKDIKPTIRVLPDGDTLITYCPYIPDNIKINQDKKPVDVKK